MNNSILGIRVEIDGSLSEFNYIENDIIRNELTIYARERGSGQFELLEVFVAGQRTYFMYGWKHGYNFNRLRLDSCSATGNILIVAFNSHNPVNVDKNDILNYYRDDFRAGRYDILDIESTSSSIDFDFSEDEDFFMV